MSTESLQFDETAFDPMAADYDASFTATRLGRELRSTVWKQLDLSLPERGRIAEIGCGTGEDAVHLALNGYQVLATDASQQMLEVAAAKARQAGCEDMIEFAHVPMERLASELAGECFDGVFSNFGVFNCASDSAALARDVAALLKPGAPLVAVLMGRYVPWEWVWFVLRLDWRKASRRLGADGTIWRGMRIVYPTPGEFEAALSPYFEEVRAAALGFVLPPSYASAWLNERPRVFDLVARAERKLQRFESLAACSDHYVVKARRNTSTADA